MSTLKAWVHTLKYEAQDIISVDLRPMPGETLPAFEAGAHIDLHLPGGLVRSYSLANDCRERHRYLLGILKDKASRGGSRAVHEQLRVGMALTISAPRNNFPLYEDADHAAHRTAQLVGEEGPRQAGVLLPALRDAHGG